MAKNNMKKRTGRKKKRINTRALAIVGLTTVIFGGIAGGLVYIKVKGSVGRNMVAARAFLEEGNHEKALRSVGKVLYKESGNQEAHALRGEIFETMIPETPQRATQLFGDYLVAVRQHAQFTPGDEQLALRSLDLLWEAAMGTDAAGFWSTLQGEAAEQRARFEKGTPAYNRATLMLGLAKMRLGQSNFLGDVDATGHVRFPGEAELAEYVELEPQSDDGLSRLAFGRMAVARQLGMKGRVQQEERNLEMAQASYDEALARNPEGPETLLAVIRHLYVHELVADLRKAGGQEAVETRLNELMERLEQAEAVIGSGGGIQRHQVLELARYLALIDLAEGHTRSAALLARYLEREPTDLNVRVQLAEAQRRRGDLQAAVDSAQQVLDAEALPVSLGSSRQQLDQLMAAVVQFQAVADLRMDEDSELLRRDAQDARDLMVDLVGGDDQNGLVLEMDGRLAYSDSQMAQAVSAFERAVASGHTLSPDALRESADALERVGQSGLAVDRLKAVVESQPRSVRNRLLLASLYSRMNSTEKALEVLESIPPAVRASNPDIERMESSLRLAIVDPSQRADLAGGLQDEVLRVIAQADSMMEAGEEAKAAGLLEGMAASHPEDVRLLMALAHLYVRLDQRDKAIAFADRAVALQPDNRRMAQLAQSLKSADPVEELQVQVAGAYQEGIDRDVAEFIAMRGLASEQAKKSASLASTDPDGAREAEVLAARAEAIAASHEDAVRAAASSHPQAFAWTFDAILKDGDFEAAEALLPQARDSNLDMAEGHLAEARMLLARAAVAAAEDQDVVDLYERAALSASRATEVAGWRSATWEMLAQARLGLGATEDARAAYEKIIAQDPANLAAIGQLAALHMQEGGDSSRAVSLLREASTRFPGNRQMREAWLRVESSHGDRAVALAERQRDWMNRPDDRQAALWFAGLMAALQPDYRYALDEAARPMISGRAWLGMNAQQQERALEQIQSTWDRRISKIADDLAGSPNRSVQETLQHATVLREAGRRSEMVALLNAWLDSHRDADDVTTQAIQIARFMLSADQFYEAVSLLESWRDYQAPATMEVDTALGAMFHERALCEQAVEHVQSVYDATRASAMGLRLGDCLIRMQRLDEAAEVIRSLAQGDADQYQLAMLEAGLGRARGTVAEAAGDLEAAMAHRADFRKALDRASAIRQDRPAPYVQLVKSLIIEYRRTLDRAKLEEALRYCTAAADLDVDSPQLVAQTADVYEAMGDPRRAVLELESYLRKDASADDVRERLARAYVTAGTPSRAIDVLEQGIAMEPKRAYWHGLLADHLRRSGGSLKDATSAYIKAWTLQPSRGRLTALLDATRANEPWDYEAAIEAIRAHSGEIAKDPRVLGLKARAEAGLHLPARARESLREEYMLVKAAIAQGSIPDALLVQWYQDLSVVYPSGDAAEPMALVEEVTEGSPTAHDRRGLAMFHANRSEFPQAIEVLGALVSEAGDDVQGGDLRDLGSLQLRAERSGDAIETFRQLVDLDPNDPGALNNLAYLMATLSDDPEAAAPLIRRAVELNPSEPAFIDTMATVQSMLGRKEAALSSWLAALAIQPNNVPLLRTIALTLTDDLNRAADATAYADHALSIDPRGAETLDVAGWSAYQAGEIVKGQDLVGQSIRRQPTARAHLHMADILLKSGDRTGAREHLKQAERLAGTNDAEITDQIALIRSDLDGGR